jgi:hypothetical protein
MRGEVRLGNTAFFLFALLFTLAVFTAGCGRGNGESPRRPGGTTSTGWHAIGGEGGTAGVGGQAGAAETTGVAGAAGGSSGGGDAGTEAGRDATTTTGCGTCGAGTTCAYLIADGCSAVGTCVAIPAPEPCNAVSLLTACGCDGRSVSWHGACQPDLPEGFAPAPVVHTGGCP